MNRDTFGKKNQTELWEQFSKTGSIHDYLAYKQKEKRIMQDDPTTEI